MHSPAHISDHTESTFAPDDSTSTGQIIIHQTEKIYINKHFGVTFHYPSAYDLIQEYPSSWPPTTSLALAEPYIVSLSEHDNRYTVAVLKVFPESAWSAVTDPLKLQLERAHLNSTAAIAMILRSDTTRNLPIYYIEHPSMPYFFTLEFVNGPANREDWKLFDTIVNSIDFGP